MRLQDPRAICQPGLVRLHGRGSWECGFLIIWLLPGTDKSDLERSESLVMGLLARKIEKGVGFCGVLCAGRRHEAYNTNHKDRS